MVNLPAVKVGRSLHMSCIVDSDNRVSWLHVRYDSADQSKIYENGLVVDQYKQKFQAVPNHVGGNYSLTLLNAQTNDSGWYMCVVVDGGSILDNRVSALNVTLGFDGKCFHCFCLMFDRCKCANVTVNSDIHVC